MKNTIQALLRASVWGLAINASVATWYLILNKGIGTWVLRRRAVRVVKRFWAAPSLAQALTELDRWPAADAFTELIRQGMGADTHYRQHRSQTLGEACTHSEFVTRALCRCIEMIRARLEGGLTLLASVGSTAPFVGLFGTVWGTYHALIRINISGQATLEQVASPVGEALIMTASGLAVAVPAVIAYNAFVRANRMILAQLDALAHERTHKPLVYTAWGLSLSPRNSGALPGLGQWVGGNEKETGEEARLILYPTEMGGITTRHSYEPWTQTIRPRQLQGKGSYPAPKNTLAFNKHLAIAILCAGLSAGVARAGDNSGTQAASVGNTRVISQVTELPEVTVRAPVPEAFTAPSPEEARETLSRVPGGTTLIESKEFRDGVTGNLQEVLSLSPGVYVQSRFGGGETRTSIRGSGISLTFNTRGIRFLLNGLPFSEADGNFRPQLVEPLAMRYVEVYRGANALQYGAAFLGGAINFVSPTGYSAAPLLGHMEYGAFDYIRPQLSAAGMRNERVDGYLSLSGIFQDGFRPQAEEKTYRLYGNLGYRFTENSETRLHVSVQDNNLELPGSLTKMQVEQDPTQANTFWQMRGAQRNFNLYRTDLQHAAQLAGQDRLDVGVYYQRLDMFHPLPFTLIESSQNDTGVSLRHTHQGQLGALSNRILWGGTFAWGDNDQEEFQSLGRAGEPVKGRRTKAQDMEALTAEIFAEDQLALTEQLTLVGGLQLAYASRETEITFGAGITADEDYFGVNPKAGFLYQATDAIQFFGNVSRSFEPPINIEFANMVAGVLDAQTATTIEVGTRRTTSLLSWELAIYHSWIEDEILIVDPRPPSGQFVTFNAQETTLHTGVELGVNARLPLKFLHGGSNRGDFLHLLANYTYNRFVFDNEPSWGDNDIPGIPTQFGRVELLYEHPSGFYIGPTLEAADSWFVDFANTLEADAYWVLGAKAGYNTKQVSVFIEGRNLTDENYASNTSVIADAGGRDQVVFNPGMPAAVFGGIEVRF